jgi:ATP-dependent helicase/DNAse subunit B
LSATQLDSYATCPGQYLVRHRLKLRPIQSLEERFALIFGTAVHLSLERYFKTHPNDLTTLFKEALESLYPEIQKERSIYFMMSRQFQEVARHFVVLEEQLKSQFNFKDNQSLEKGFETEMGGYFYSGKIDRIIEREEGSLLLIDYKTGRVDFSPKDISNGHGSQALLYLLSVTAQGGPPCVGVLFYDLKAQELRRGIFREEMISKELKKELTRGHALSQEKFSELIESGKSHLISNSQSIEQGQFAATPNSQECSRCEAVTFCRQGLGYV